MASMSYFRLFREPGTTANLIQGAGHPIGHWQLARIPTTPIRRHFDVRPGTLSSRRRSQNRFAGFATDLSNKTPQAAGGSSFQYDANSPERRSFMSGAGRWSQPRAGRITLYRQSPMLAGHKTAPSRLCLQNTCRTALALHRHCYGHGLCCVATITINNDFTSSRTRAVTEIATWPICHSQISQT